MEILVLIHLTHAFILVHEIATYLSDLKVNNRKKKLVCLTL